MADYSQFAFIFDMDGTLIDNMHFHTKAWQQMLNENGIELSAEEFLVTTAGRTNDEIIPGIFGDISAEEINKLAERKEQLYREFYLPHRKPLNGAFDFLEAADELGIAMGIASAAPTQNAEFILDGLRLRRFFQSVITADDGLKGKPDPAMFLKSAENLGVDTANCIVFEDAVGGFQAAHRAGMRSIGIATVNSIEKILSYEGVLEAHKDFSNLAPMELIKKYLKPAVAAM